MSGAGELSPEAEVFDLRFRDMGPVSIAVAEWELFRSAGELAGKLLLHSVSDFHQSYPD